MKVYELFEAVQGSPGQGGKLRGGAYYAPKYDNDAKQIRGSVIDWREAMGITPADVAEAFAKVKASKVFKDLEAAGLKYSSGATQEKLGTFKFDTDKGGYKGGYLVYANGQLRSHTTSSWHGGDYTTPLKTPKPKMKAGDPVGSLVMIYTAALEEVLAKHKKFVAKQK
jgi:hypothetical protein